MARTPAYRRSSSTRARRRTRRPAAPARRRSPARWLRTLLRRTRRRTARYLRRHARKAGRALVRRSMRAVRRTRWHYELKAANRRLAAHAALSNPATARSITGRPRPARAAQAVPVPGASAPMEQRVRRDKGGRFNGSVSSGAKKTTSAKKAAAAKQTADQRKAAAFQKSLTQGNQRAARIDKRLDATEARIDRMLQPPKTTRRNP